MNYIAENLKFLRTLSNLSQSDFAKKVDLNRGNITSYERGIATPNIDALQRITKSFNVSLVQFIEKDLSQEIKKGQFRLQNDDLEEYTANSHEDTSIPTFQNISESIQPLLNSLDGSSTPSDLNSHLNNISSSLERLADTMESIVKLNKQLVSKKQEVY